MAQILEIVGVIFLFIGVIFSALGVLGILRLPDTYTRLHASGKTSTLGVLFLALGTAFLLPSALLKLIALSIFMIFAGPVGSHAIAAALHRGTAVTNQRVEESGEGSVLSSGIHNYADIQRIIKDGNESP